MVTNVIKKVTCLNISHNRTLQLFLLIGDFENAILDIYKCPFSETCG